MHISSPRQRWRICSRRGVSETSITAAKYLSSEFSSRGKRILFRKLTMKLYCRNIIGPGRIFWGVESAKFDLPVFAYDGCSPPSGIFIEANSAESAFIVTSKSAAILKISSVSAFPKIVSAIVKRVVVYMIYLFSFDSTKYQPMHFYTLSKRIEGPSGRSVAGGPNPSREPLKISGVNFGNLPFRKGYKSMVRWLDDLSSLCKVSHLFIIPRVKKK